VDALIPDWMITVVAAAAMEAAAGQEETCPIDELSPAAWR